MRHIHGQLCMLHGSSGNGTVALFTAVAQWVICLV